MHADGLEFLAPGIRDRRFAVSVSMIGVPSAACSENSFMPGAIFGACGNKLVHVLGTDRLDIGQIDRRRDEPAPPA